MSHRNVCNTSGCIEYPLKPYGDCVKHTKPEGEAGGTKHDSDKPDLSLLPFKALEDVARVMMFGAAKYGRSNWKKGFDEHRLISAALRHLGAHTEGEAIDSESGQAHLAHAACNLLFLIWLKKSAAKSSADAGDGAKK